MKYDFDHLNERKEYASEKWYGPQGELGAGDPIPLSIADMDFQAPQPVVDRLVETARCGVYGTVRRPESYYDAIIGWMKRRYHWNIQKEWIGAAPRIIPAIGFAVQALTQPGDRVIFQPPTYDNFPSIVEKAGREAVANPLIFENGGYHMDLCDLARKAGDPRCKMLILCNPQNPVGRAWSREELEEAGRICLENGVVVLTDQAYADLTMPTHELVPFASISEEFAQHSVTVTSLSKSFNLAGIQTAYVIIPDKKMFDAYDGVIDALHLKRISLFTLVAVESAYEHGDEWLNQVVRYIQGNLQFLREYLRTSVPRIHLVEPDFAYLVWLDLRGLGLDRDQLHTFLLKDARIIVNEGWRYGEGGEGFVRMNIATSRENLKVALDRIKHAVDLLEPGHPFNAE